MENVYDFIMFLKRKAVITTIRYAQRPTIV